MFGRTASPSKLPPINIDNIRYRMANDSLKAAYDEAKRLGDSVIDYCNSLSEGAALGFNKMAMDNSLILLGRRPSPTTAPTENLIKVTSLKGVIRAIRDSVSSMDSSNFPEKMETIRELRDSVFSEPRDSRNSLSKFSRPGRR